MSSLPLATVETLLDLKALQGQTLLQELARKSRPGERAEELLFDLGLVSERDFALELALRSQIAYVGLRGFVPDERLFLYVPLQTAQAERLCPLVIVGDSLKLASAFLDPDLSVIRRRFPHLDVQLVLSPRGEILSALQHLSHIV